MIPFSFQHISRENTASVFTYLRNLSLVIPPAAVVLGGCFEQQFSFPLCGTGCVPPFWLSMRAAVLIMKGFLSSLPLLSWELSSES